jgi:hypothetical protein
MKQKLQKFLQTKKTKLLKFVQAKLRKFLQNEYRTPNEIERDNINVYLNALMRATPYFPVDDAYYAGEIRYVVDKSDGKSYYKDSKKNKWFCDFNQDNIPKEELGKWIEENSYTDEQLKQKLGVITTFEDKVRDKLLKTKLGETRND